MVCTAAMASLYKNNKKWKKVILMHIQLVHRTFPKISVNNTKISENSNADNVFTILWLPWSNMRKIFPSQVIWTDFKINTKGSFLKHSAVVVLQVNHMHYMENVGDDQLSFAIWTGSDPDAAIFTMTASAAENKKDWLQALKKLQDSQRAFAIGKEILESEQK